MRIVELQVEERVAEGNARNARVGWNERRSWVVTIQTAGGAMGEGEAAPLPGYSPDDPEEVQDFLRSWAGSTVVLDTEGVRVWPVLSDHTPPSAAFALEQAVLTAAAREQGLTLREVLGGVPGRAVPVQAMLDDPASAGTRAQLALRHGVCTFKLKVGGSRDLRDDLLTYREAVTQAALSEGVRADRLRFRLDANGTAPHGWEEVVQQILPSTEWIEEPVPDAAQKLPPSGSVPWALDESLAPVDPERWRRTTDALGALVLKPTLLGGLRKCLGWSELARRWGVPVCVSHCFEIGAGFEGALALAAAVHRPGEVHGLFPHDFLSLPPRLHRGELMPPEAELDRARGTA